MMVITEKHPLLARQEGVWDGEYVHLDADHNIIDRHQSRLVCRLEDGKDGEAKLKQTNIYTWGNNDQEIRYFEGVYQGDRLWIKNDLIDGWSGTIDLDSTQRTIMVGWVRSNEPDLRFYEMITVAEDGETKNRTWHWYRRGRLFQRTLINEIRVAHDWRPYDDPAYYANHPRASQ